ncbi:hypothetical protein JCM33374_g6081 [Metschnikowia sp. JCM 33374]|nr:hypothetical protein JCM33374_g6081 [Metschnikowia sp. JCM 33374]
MLSRSHEQSNDWGNVHRLGNMARITDTQKAEDSLETFAARLTSLVNDTCFDTFEFFEISTHLAEELALIEKLAWHTECTEDFLIRFSFTKYMYRVMVASSETLNLYGPLWGMAQQLLCKVTHLNVRLVVLYNRYGMPHHKIRDSSATVLGYARDLQDWEKRFRCLENKSFEMTSIFRGEYTQAKNTIKIFSRLMSKRDRVEYQAMGF